MGMVEFLRETGGFPTGYKTVACGNRGASEEFLMAGWLKDYNN